MTEIIVAIITAVGLLSAQAVVSKRTHNTSEIKQQAAMEAMSAEIKNQNNAIQTQLKNQNEAVLYRLGQLEKKQDKHNKLIERTYSLEKCVEVHEEKIKVANHRIEDLEARK